MRAAADQTNWVAIYAAVVATLSFFVAATSLGWHIRRRRREERTTVEVRAVYDAVPDPKDDLTGEVDMIR